MKKDIVRARTVFDREEKKLRALRKKYFQLRKRYGGPLTVDVITAEAQYRRAMIDYRHAMERLRTLLIMKKNRENSRVNVK